MAKDALTGRVFEMRAQSAAVLHGWDAEAFRSSKRHDRESVPIRTAIRRHYLRCHLTARMLRTSAGPRRHLSQSGAV